MTFVRTGFCLMALFVTLGVFAAAQPVQAADDGIKAAVVDIEKIFAEAKAAKSLEKQIQAKREAFQKEFAEKEKQLKTTEAALVGEKEKLNAEEFGKKRKAFEGKIMEVRSLFQKRRNALDQGVSKAMTTLRKNIVEAAAKIADEKKYDVVLTRDSVLIAAKNLDITDDVLKALDAQVTDIKLQVE